MATKKDLVEAHAFSRRRLVTAFVSGAPGGREVEPVRPGRVLIGGVALSVLLLAGAAIAGFLLGRPPAQWLEKGSFIISKDTGEQYVVLRGGEDPEIQRVPNYVSAQLLLGEAELTPYTVRDKYIRTVDLGEDLGIEGAPASLPAAEELVDDGWTACTADGAGVKVAVQDDPQVRDVTDSAFVVRSDGRPWLIAPSPDAGGQDGTVYRFELPADDVLAGTLADRLAPGAAVPEVGEAWLNLFRRGSALDRDSFAVTRSGQPARYDNTTTDLSAFSIGDMVETSGGATYLLADDGPQRLNEFAALVYGVVGGAAIPFEGQISSTFDGLAAPAEWPAAQPTPLSGGAMCAVLHPGAGTASRVSLAVEPTGAADLDGIRPGRHEVDVEPGGGAYVLSGSDESAADGTPYVIDTKGQKYQLVGTVVPDYIGYGDVEPRVVPSAWLTFFREGVPLSTNAARRVPEDAPPPADDEAEAS